MNLRSTLIFAGFASVAVSTPGIAADLPTMKEPPALEPVVAPWSWTGFYAGGYLGGTFGSANWSDGGYNGTYWGTSGNSNTQSGFTGGGYVGANYQFQQFVIGIEGEYGYSGLGNDGQTWSGNQTDAGGNLYPYSLTQKFNDTGIGRIRGRLGYAVQPELLLYVVGGWTFASTNSSLGGYCCGTTGANPIPPATVAPGVINPTYFNVSDNKSLSGWNIGFGGEYAFTPNWIARIEYIYDGFSRLSYGYNYTTVFNDNRNVGLNINTIRVGLEYKF